MAGMTDPQTTVSNVIGPPLSSRFPTHDAASRIARAARRLGFRVSRDAASGYSRSAYVTVHQKKAKSIRVRISDHQQGRAWVDIDVHVGEPRPGAVDWQTAVLWLQGRIWEETCK